MIHKLFSQLANSFKCLLNNKRLIITLARRDIMQRYQGSVFGVLWSIINPIIMLGIYTFIFSVVFKAKWGGVDDKYQFSMLLFSGLIVFNCFSDIISRSPTLIVNYSNYVTKVIFPIEILPFVITISAMFNFILSFMIWVIFYFILIGPPSITIILLPFILLPFILMCNGFAWVFSSIGVYIRDLNQVVMLGVSAMMFMTPIFYPISAIPEKYQHYLFISPITSVIESFRDLAINGVIPDLSQYVSYCITSIVIYWFGYMWFKKVSKGFSDVL
jgi:lipopolysaccharide transport system permease protein